MATRAAKKATSPFRSEYPDLLGKRVDVILFGRFPGVEANWITTRALVVAEQQNLDLFCVVFGTDFIWVHLSQLFNRRFDGDEKGYDQ
jgi:hypothetical protein